MEEVIIVGAGPCGLSAAIELQQIGIRPLILEKKAIVHSIYQYPTYLQFFSTPELLEIGGIPFTTPNEKPYRQEALHYYRKVASHYDLRIHSYTAVEKIQSFGHYFELEAVRNNGETILYQAKKVIIATGYFDYPNMIGIPGEDLSKVTHYYKEAHPYSGAKVAIIGGNNSAVDAAMDLIRVGAEVTVVYRRNEFSANIKPWVRPLFESMVDKGRIRMLFNSRVTHIHPDTVTIESEGKVSELDNDFVLALTGFRPDRKLLASIGITIQGEHDIPEFNPETMETNVKGLYLAGVIASGSNANEIFIETGRHHGRSIAEHLARKNK
jgi:thioredoxin reductase (NADPH)